MVSALQLITGQRSFAGYNTQSSVVEPASACGISSAGPTTTISAAGCTLTAADDEDGSEDPTGGTISVRGARDGPEVAMGLRVHFLWILPSEAMGFSDQILRVLV